MHRPCDRPCAYNVLVWSSGTLPVGRHTLKLRVTGAKNVSSMGYYVLASGVRRPASGVRPTPCPAISRFGQTLTSFRAALTVGRAKGILSSEWFCDMQGCGPLRQLRRLAAWVWAGRGLPAPGTVQTTGDTALIEMCCARELDEPAPTGRPISSATATPRASTCPSRSAMLSIRAPIWA